MRPSLCARAPSSALLHFLKLQSDRLCGATSRPRPRLSVPRSPRPALRATAPWDGSSSPARAAGMGAATARSHTTICGPVSRPRACLSQRAWAARIGACRVGVWGDRVALGLRWASSRRESWRQRLWGLSSRKSQTLQPDDLPAPNWQDSGDTSMFSLGRAVSAKAANEQKLRCTEFDEGGNVVLVNGEFKKSELIAKYGLLPRDLRKIDSSILPHILVRPSAILINLLHLRVLIKANRVLVFDVYGSTDSYTQSVFMYDLEGKLRQKQNSPSAGGLPYEFRALEAVLISVTSGLEAEFEGVREPVVRVLRDLEEDIDRDKLRHLLIYSKKLGTFEQKAKLVRDSIDELLEADDDLAAMYLTEKTHDLIRGEDDHTEIEMLLESYHKICDEIYQASSNLVSNIRNTEEIVKAILDANRNSLMLLDLKFSIGTLGIGSGAFVAALYGMNLKNFMEEADLGFLSVTTSTLLLTLLVFAYGLTKLRKVQRVSMWSASSGRRDHHRPSALEMTSHERSEKIRRMREAKLDFIRHHNKEMAAIQEQLRLDPPKRG